MLVEEIPKSTNAHSSTIYFSSSINLTARSMNKSHVIADGGQQSGSSGTDKKGRAKVNYNVNQLMNAQIGDNRGSGTSSVGSGSGSGSGGPLKSVQQIQLERLVSKRIVELNQESSSSSKTFELPKNFTYNTIHSAGKKISQKSRLGNTPSTKRILAARRNLNSYFEEERNLISINTILQLNYQFVDFHDYENKPKSKKQKTHHIYRPKLRLCCICGSSSSYSRCSNCGLFYCSVKCNNLHQQSRCT
ncbi:uncharacterized protein SPAPADRAFT_142917 [Spathaspora passalidarum NRRL Y-27907]|uniref:HIT-type domain-containing protein n=1 Tax=Spathaspora passalidarum (strain NRRL Y-27907 / 11-Y1) TaxID=619300 RepID=G3ASW6_SPAPN|nr:uncharacterized protein SPAPADRAFT_142917 [Spathaspora passalidarum NRRL Y-27907]EGW30748.1 hypothetical protein SPAPADRAFT_142917 [Spathaspora passalidarum NRRL Y-27907]